jgi:hypothetical protein
MLVTIALLVAGALSIYLGILLIHGPTEALVGFGLVLVAIGVGRIVRDVMHRSHADR